MQNDDPKINSHNMSRLLLRYYFLYDPVGRFQVELNLDDQM